MIQVKPAIDHRPVCPVCTTVLTAERVLWQGIHVCATASCPTCSADIVQDLPVGHGRFAPCTVDRRTNKLYLDEPHSVAWYGRPFLRALQHPLDDPAVTLTVERFFDARNVIILNCIDYLYGHALLKLLNAESHLTEDREFGLVLILPSYLRWLAPKGVCEIWTVTVPLAKARDYYPQLDERIRKECERFDTIYLSPAHSHPSQFSVSNFTGIPTHDRGRPDFRITFIWRENRIWAGFLLDLFSRFKATRPLPVLLQNLKIRRLFSGLRSKFPKALFTVVGQGTSTRFPSWIDDQRVERYSLESERRHALIYSESRCVIGIHGSHMLLPSAHAGLVVDLMPRSRWGNFAQDILFQERDVRLAAYRYRFISTKTSATLAAHIASEQIFWYEDFQRHMLPERQSKRHGMRET
ncbi:MAG: hypothetical protein OEW15_16665 [Nitrospirota bacterium]|nr:hypothetical protein [Nitrospirota bacterium]